MIRYDHFLFLLIFFFLCGCRTIPKNVEKKETNNNVESALTSIANAVSQRELTAGEVKNFEKQIRRDKEAQSAVQVISDSMSRKNVRIKYCPICGKRFDPKIIQCPTDKVKLEYIE